MNKYIKYLIFILLVFWLIIFGSSIVYAQPADCGPTKNVIEQLKTRWGEEVIGVGLRTSGGLIQILLSQDGKTWTILSSTPAGVSCEVAAGSNWQWYKLPKEFTDVNLKQ